MDKKVSDLWDKEWGSNAEETVPHQSEFKPTGDVVRFFDEIDSQKSKGLVLDIGCGIGRHVVYAAELGYLAIGIDVSIVGLKKCQEYIKDKAYPQHPVLMHISATDKLPLLDNSVNIAIDSLTTVGIKGHENRRFLAQEMHRVLAPKGIALVRLVSANDENEQMLMKTNPGPEKNSSLWPKVDKFQKNFSLEEIEELYSDLFEIQAEEVHKTAIRRGKTITATNWYVKLIKK
ncbi:class I SAM-dependent methyltransferase [Candidatus Dojkabacteria bacterium]|uniref:Class I SAM-dependent methyltransferase n=1 Tax=Candidatus Dojkabacteria bacterium TaxID=2099670 RepID=A0A955L653_9BACT|nr:class I SAM-dependent methyltransferase [Candidatus Dojkabacteria bacterium]